MLSSPHGFSCRLSCAQLSTSKNSSSVPMPPGSATKPSASSAMTALRSCIDLTTRSSVSPRCASSLSTRNSGMTPTDSPPCFMALPGGIGTLEEFFEVLSWAQLSLHEKPCGLLSVGGYYEGIVNFLDHAVAEGFLKPKHRALLIVEATPERLLDRFDDIIHQGAT